MSVKVFRVLLLASAATGVLFFSSPSSAQEKSDECVAGESVSAFHILQKTAAFCCSLNSKQNRCLDRARTRIRLAKAVIGDGVAAAARGLLVKLQNAACDLNELKVPECTSDGSTTHEEAANNIAEKACGLKRECAREKRLKQLRRKAQRARKYLSGRYFKRLRREIKSLMESKQCGNGGAECGGGAFCSRVSGWSDGANGNVWKNSDHGNYPVAVTHIGPTSAELFTKNGVKFAHGTYTGTANPDSNGPRDHYRFFSVSCSSIPSSFYLKLGGTCFEMNGGCSRID